MKNVVEIHILQNFAPSLLNRDDTGSPKDCEFGGYRRSRISSQCLKRAVRQYVRAKGLIGVTHLAVRTKRLSEEIVRRLPGRPVDQVEAAVKRALAGLKLSVGEDHKTQYLLFLGEQEIGGLAALVNKNWDALTAEPPTAAEAGTKSKKAEKKAAKEALPADLAGRLGELMNGGQAVDLALFGRMLADLPEKNIDAACQIAHAISTNAVTREFDFYTAVDDLKPSDTAGADMMGTVEFNSACYYRYAVLDLEKLGVNLGGDRDLTETAVAAFLEGFVWATPTGKQNSFAAHNPPVLIAMTVRQEAMPMSLANAFETPVRPHRERGLSACSVERLDAEWRRLDQAFGQGGKVACLCLDPTPLDYLRPQVVGSLAELITRTMAEVRPIVRA